MFVKATLMKICTQVVADEVELAAKIGQKFV
jgi:hypothetical protein